MLPIRDPPQNKRPVQTESEGLETNFPSKWTGKKIARLAILISEKIDFKSKAIKRVTEGTEGHFIILKGRIHQKHLYIKNIYVPNIGAQKYIRKTLQDFKKDTDSNTLILGDFYTPLSKMDISSKQNTNKDISSLNNALDQLCLTNIDR